MRTCKISYFASEFNFLIIRVLILNNKEKREYLWFFFSILMLLSIVIRCKIIVEFWNVHLISDTYWYICTSFGYFIGQQRINQWFVFIWLFVVLLDWIPRTRHYSISRIFIFKCTITFNSLIFPPLIPLKKQPF